MSTLWQDIQYKMLKSHSRLSLLIGVNVILFLAVNIVSVIWKLANNMGDDTIMYYTNEYLLLPASLPKLAHRFWTPFTYMFMHAGFSHPV